MKIKRVTYYACRTPGLRDLSRFFAILFRFGFLSSKTFKLVGINLLSLHMYNKGYDRNASSAHNLIPMSPPYFALYSRYIGTISNSCAATDYWYSTRTLFPSTTKNNRYNITDIQCIVIVDLDTHISIDSHTATSGLRYFSTQILKLGLW